MQDMNTLTVFPKGFPIDQHVDQRVAQEILVPRLQRLLELNDPIHKLDMDLPIHYPVEGVREICRDLTGRVSSVTHATVYNWAWPPETAHRAFVSIGALLSESPVLKSISIPLSRQVLESMNNALSSSTLREVTFHHCGYAEDGLFARLREIMSTVTDQTNGSRVLDNLTLLHLMKIQMFEDSAQELAELLCKVPNLRSFAYNPNANGTGSMRVLEGLRDSGGTSLEKLVFEGCWFRNRNVPEVSERSCQLLENLLSRQSRLTSLNVSNCLFNDESNALRSIAQGLSASKARLTELRLVEWQDILHCLDELIILLELQAGSLQALHMTNYLEDIDNASFGRFTGVLSRLTNLRILNVSCWGFEDNPDAVTALAGALRNLVSLEELCISFNHLSANSSAATFVRDMPNLLKLQVLDLSRNELGDNGAVALAARFPHMERLRVLNLSDCVIAADGSTAIADSVRDLPCLEVLNLSDNHRIGDASATALAGSVADHPCLRELDLSGCGIGDNAVPSLASMLRQTPSLTSLKLEGNGITITAYRGLLAALRDYQGQGPGRDYIAPNFTLTSLRVDDDDWQRQFDFYCQLNAAGRGSFLVGTTGTEEWLRGLQMMDAEAGLSGILYAVRSNPDFAESAREAPQEA